MHCSDGVVDNVKFRLICFIQVSGVPARSAYLPAPSVPRSPAGFLPRAERLCLVSHLGTRGEEAWAVVEDSKLLSVGACASLGVRHRGNWVKPEEVAGCQRRQERCRVSRRAGHR